MDTDTFDNQTAYWNDVARDKTFTLPIDLPLFKAHVPLESRILEYGCGYGRICYELTTAGYSNTLGVDSAKTMIQRGREQYPELQLVELTDPDLLDFDGVFDAIVLVAVLTCIPSDAGQRNLIGTLHRVLRPGGVLYVTDYLLQEDERNIKRYMQNVGEFGTYGVFRLPEGAVFRHHSPDWVESLLAEFETLDKSYPAVTTMNGHPARAFQYLCRKDA